MMILNCLGNLLYGVFLEDGFIFTINIIGYMLGTYYTLITLPLETKRKRIFNTYICVFCSALIFCIVGYSFMKLTFEQGKSAIGATTVFILVIFYSSPLSTVAMVIKTRNSNSIYAPLAIANGVNGILWTIYGLNQNNIVFIY